MDWSLKWKIFIDKISYNNYHNDTMKMLGRGLWVTVKIAVLGLLIGILIGTIIAAVKVAPKYKFIVRLADKICSVYTAFFRGTPLMVQLLLAYYVLLPMIGVKGVNPENVGVVIFGLNSGAYVSEMMRGGIKSVDAGQLEAARALGLGYGAGMIKIVIPQAIKNILPTLGNEFIMIVKDTSLASTFFIGDLMTQYLIVRGASYLPLEPLVIVGVIYFILTFLLSKLFGFFERRMSRADR